MRPQDAHKIGHQQICYTMTEFQDEEEAALAAASSAREKGITLIRNHLEAHLKQNPGSSFVTWIATLHPENATVVIDERFLIPGNPWWAVYEDAKEPLKKENAVTESTNEFQPNKGFLDCVVGYTLLVVSILITFSLEVVSTAIFAIECSFGWFCDSLTLTPFTSILYGSFWLTEQILHFVRLVILLVSTLVVETLAGTGLVLCTILSLNTEVGRSWHQHIRRTSHLTRWACREPLNAWENHSAGTAAEDNNRNSAVASVEAIPVYKANGDLVVVEAEPVFKR